MSRQCLLFDFGTISCSLNCQVPMHMFPRRPTAMSWRWLLKYLLIGIWVFQLVPATSLSTAEWDDVDLEAYENGNLGYYPQVTFKSMGISAPRVHVEKWNAACDSESYTLLCPHGEHIHDNKALLIDQQGQLMWYHEERGAVHSLQIQSYQGNDYITYWVGDDELYGHGRGYFKMVKIRDNYSSM